MTSHNVPVHSEAEGSMAMFKKPWAKPFVEVLALESAESGFKTSVTDGHAAHSSRPRS
jgi:hypothetical protein